MNPIYTLLFDLIVQCFLYWGYIYNTAIEKINTPTVTVHIPVHNMRNRKNKMIVTILTFLLFNLVYVGKTEIVLQM